MTADDDRQQREPASRRGWAERILVAALLGGAIGAVLATFATPAYKSEAQILVVRQGVPAAYARPTSSTTISDLESLSQHVLSRRRVESIIQEFDLYSEDRRRGGTPATLVEKMRTHVEVKAQLGETIRVGFVGTHPRTVMLVADRLASLLIEEAVRDREMLAEGTHEFLITASEDLRKRLVVKREQLRELQHAGAPKPEQEPLAIEYEVLQTTFKDLLAKIEEAQAARALEGRRLGEQLKMIEPARMPERPIAPVWREYVGIGAGAGAATGLLVLLLGVAAPLREPRDTTQREVHLTHHD
jgi:uncharacterized protein involved in exopolysaccharide biosynthesis